MFAQTPRPPYVAVIFTSQRRGDDQGYAQMAMRMKDFVSQQSGYLGMESVKDDRGFGMTVSYWESLECAHDWKAHVEHQLAQRLGQKIWYERYQVRICSVVSEYGFTDHKQGNAL